jgi:hypothetical protein
MQAVYVHPLTYFGFKRLFGNADATEILIHFLNVFLPSNYKVTKILKMQGGFGSHPIRFLNFYI